MKSHILKLNLRCELCLIFLVLAGCSHGRVIVQDPAGHAIEGANVKVTATDVGVWNYTTDRDGEVMLKIPWDKNPNIISVSKDGYIGFDAIYPSNWPLRATLKKADTPAISK